MTAYTGQAEQVPDVEDNFLNIPPKAVIPQEGNAICWAWPTMGAKWQTGNWR